jgi:hypothetical protein
MFVRDMNLDPHLHLKPVRDYMESRGQWFSVALNYGQISTCSLTDLVAAIDQFLIADPWSLVINRPRD